MAETEDRGEITVEDAELAKPFIPMYAPFMQHQKLSMGAKMAWGILLWYKWEGGYPGHDEAAETFNIGKRSLCRYLNELEDAGFVEVERPGLGKPNKYRLVSLHAKLATQGCQTGNSRTPNRQFPYNESDSVEDSNEKRKGPLRLSFEEKTELIQHLHDLWDDNSTPLQSRLTLLRPWSLEVIQEAAEITAEAQPDEPFAYLYGILKRQPTPLAEHESEEPLTDEEFQAAREEIDRINEQEPWNE